MRAEPEDSIVPLPDADPREEILRLEDEIEALAGTLERCRKVDLIAKIALLGGAIAMLSLPIGIIRFDELVLFCAITAAIGGIVAYGSNISTSRQATDELKAAEARRRELIDALVPLDRNPL